MRKHNTYSQQPACAAKLYKNQIMDDYTVHYLYDDIIEAETSTSISDMGGSFSITLLPTRPWDEIIEPDDLIRIFMGDSANQTSQIPAGAWNVASGNLKHGSSSQPANQASMAIDPNTGFLHVRMPNTAKDKRAISNLVLFEKFVGKVDRVEEITEVNGQTTTTYYQVIGRSLGSIIQDTTIYYNEWIAGMNAINIFYGQDVGVVNNSPSAFIKELMQVFLTSVPLPQWKLSQHFVDDMGGDFVKKNIELLTPRIKAYQENLKSQASKLKSSGVETVASNLVQIANDIESQPGTTPLSCISLDGFKPTYGKTFNKSFTNSQEQGLYDYLKSLSNDFANEFFFDLCPGGDPHGGRPSEKRVYPTFVMRQRPYDISGDLLKGTARSFEYYSTLLQKWSPPELSDENGEQCNLSLEDIIDCSVDVTASTMNMPGELGTLTSDDFRNFVKSDQEPEPMIISKRTGISGNDRMNGFLVLPSAQLGVQNSSPRSILSNEKDGIRYDSQSIGKFGLRMMEVTTFYAQRPSKKEQTEDYHESLKKFGHLLSNWYAPNPAFLNGSLTCRFLPDARLGVPLCLYETRLSPRNEEKKMELYYIQGVSNHFSRGRVLTTTLTVTRGIRYKFTTETSGLKTSFVDSNERFIGADVMSLSSSGRGGIA